MSTPLLWRRAVVSVGLMAVALVSGCTGRYDSSFPVVVQNKTVNTIAVLADGNQVGQVASGQTSTFNMQLAESNANVFSNGVAPTPQAQVTLTAKDTKTGALSTEKNLTLSQASSTYVTFSASDFPSVVPTVARFVTSPANPAINQEITFNAATSTVSNGSFALFVWNFGDGQTDSGVSVIHQYTRAATFTAVLTVTNDAGQSSSASRTITVSATVPQAAVNFTFSPTTPAINQDVLFTVSAGAAAGTTYAWDFGDGATTTSAGTTVTHRYTRGATYTVTLRAATTVGQPAPVSRTVTVSATPTGTVNFVFSPTSPGVGDDVFFNASATTVANVRYSWDYGDGSSGSGATPVHAYSRTGTFTITLTVVNDLEQSLSTSRTITVSSVSTAIAADFTFSPTDPSISRQTNTVIFDATPSSSVATSWTWDFGDGTTVGGQKAAHLYARVGTWVVRLTIADARGRTASVSKNVTVAQ
jgi:PKD repeat protein